MTRPEEEFYMTQIKAAKRIAELLETRRESAKTDEKIAGHLNDINVSLARIADTLEAISEQIKWK